jgi:hypothetical protein
MTDDEWRTREARIAAEDARLDRLTAARDAVVKAAMAWHRATMRPRVVTEEHLDAACAALAKLEGK